MNAEIPMITSLALFSIGLFGVLIKRDIPRILISVSIILGSIALLLVTLATQQNQNYSFVLFIWVVEVMEIIIGLSVFIYLNRNKKVELNDLQQLKW